MSQGNPNSGVSGTVVVHRRGTGKGVSGLDSVLRDAKATRDARKTIEEKDQTIAVYAVDLEMVWNKLDYAAEELGKAYLKLKAAEGRNAELEKQIEQLNEDLTLYACGGYAKVLEERRIDALAKEADARPKDRELVEYRLQVARAAEEALLPEVVMKQLKEAHDMLDASDRRAGDIGTMMGIAGKGLHIDWGWFGVEGLPWKED
jgi:hypothetical protein